MIIHSIWGQRKMRYPGEYGPEFLDGIDDNGHDENPTWIHDRVLFHQSNPDLSVVRLITIDLGKNAEREIGIFLQGVLVVKGQVSVAEKG